MRWRSVVGGLLLATFVALAAHAFVAPLGFFDPTNQSYPTQSSSGGAVQFNNASNSGLVAAALGF